MRVYALVSMISGLLLFFFGIHCSSKIVDPKARLRIAIPLLILALPLFVFQFNYESPLVVEFRSIPDIELANGLWGFVFGFFWLKNEAIPNRPVWIVLLAVHLAVLVIFLIRPFYPDVLYPLDPYEIQTRWGHGDGVCLQSTGYTCAPAAIATLLKHFGIDRSERDAAVETMTSPCRGGTRLWDIIRYLRRLGFQTKFLMTADQDLTKIPSPAIVSMDLRLIGHSVVWFGLNREGKRVIGDPLIGRMVLTEDDYDRLYRFLGLAVVVSLK